MFITLTNIEVTVPQAGSFVGLPVHSHTESVRFGLNCPFRSVMIGTVDSRFLLRLHATSSAFRPVLKMSVRFGDASWHAERHG